MGEPSGAPRRPAAHLSDLPLLLSRTSEQDVMRVAAQHLVHAVPSLQYVRISLVSDALKPTDVWDLCQNQRIPASMEQLQQASSKTSQLMAMQQKQMVSTALLSPELFDDWHLLVNTHGMRGAAAVPLCVASKVYGVILFASEDPLCITKESMPTLEAAGSMLAPYAAMMNKQQKLQVTKHVLELLLPPRVVATISERLGWGNNQLELQH